MREWAYEAFLRTHQILVAVNVYGIIWHLPKNSHFARMCIFIALGTLTLTSFLQLMVFLYRNGLFAVGGCPRAIVQSHQVGGEQNGIDIQHEEQGGVDIKHEEQGGVEIKDGVVKMCISLPRPIKVEPGQYINLWMPTISLWSWAQTHPFTVVSWSPERQGTLELLVQPSRGFSFSARIFRHIQPFKGASISFVSFYTGPHGISQDVNTYESVLVVANGFGIATVVPYIRHMIYGYNVCTSQVRRIHLVWQVESDRGELAPKMYKPS